MVNHSNVIFFYRPKNRFDFTKHIIITVSETYKNLGFMYRNFQNVSVNRLIAYIKRMLDILLSEI
jgi:hypothetical protein